MSYRQESTEQRPLKPRLLLVCCSFSSWHLGLNCLSPHEISGRLHAIIGTTRRVPNYVDGIGLHGPHWTSPLTCLELLQARAIETQCCYVLAAAPFGRHNKKTRIICWSCCGDQSMGCDPGRCWGTNVFEDDKFFHGMQH